jgi:hypothetical protein
VVRWARATRVMAWLICPPDAGRVGGAGEWGEAGEVSGAVGGVGPGPARGAGPVFAPRVRG